MATISLFRHEVAPNGLGAPSHSSPTIAIRPTSAPRPDTIDARLIAVLDTPLGLGETAHAGYARKEHELGAVFASLSWQESRAMHLRLSTVKAGDELAAEFARLTIVRRVRLLNFLSDARNSCSVPPSVSGGEADSPRGQGLVSPSRMVETLRGRY